MASGSAPDPWPPPELARQLDVPMGAAEWPPPDLDQALGPEGVTELTPAPTADGLPVSPAVARVRYGAAAAQGMRGDGDPGSP